MRYALPVSVALIALLSGIGAPRAGAQTRQDATVNAATAVLNESMAIPAKGIPTSLLANARGVAIIPNVLKGGLVVGVRRGHGVLLVRGDDGAWTAPSFITLTGGSFGWQVGVQSTDLILVFKTRKSIQGVMQNKFTIGVDAAAAAGPVGRNASAATDASLKAEILSYSRSRGLFAGVSVDGSVIDVDRPATAAYYQAPAGVPNNAPAPAATVIPAPAVNLIRVLTTYSSPAAGAPGVVISSNGAPIASVIVPATEPTPLVPVASIPAVPNAADSVRANLVLSAQKLQGMLDAQWRSYLALPAEVYGTGAHANVAALRAVEARFAATIQNPSYTTLTSRPEFQSTYAQLQKYLAIQQAQPDGKLQLPAPPAGIPTQGDPNR